MTTTNTYIDNTEQSLKAVVIEDDHRLGEIMLKMLKLQGYSQVRLVRRCGNAVALLDTLGPHDVDLVVCDLVLPDGDGFLVLSHLADRGYAGKVIIISGNDPRLLATAATQADFSGLDVAGTLAKPFSLHKLAEMLTVLGPEEEVCQNTNRFQFSLNAFEQALADGDIRARFHPIVDARTQQITGIEALARWQHPQHGLIAPAQFMPQVEASPLSDPFLLEMLRQVLDAQQKLAETGYLVNAAVNVGSGQLNSFSLTNRFVSLVREFDADPDTVVLEITETQGFGEPRAAMETLNRLRLQGFRLSVDDYGTGFSSLERLRTLPFTELKVDRQFVAGAASNDELTAILRHCVELADQFNLASVAEGIESFEDWQLVKSLGFGEAQGFFFSKPLELDALLAWPQRRMSQPPAHPAPRDLHVTDQFQRFQM
ncbi:MAG: EAL domain-containing protein [Lysobacterales bacterium]